MLRYLAKRILYATAVLLAVSLLTFFMSTLAPGDLVDAHVALDSGGGAFQYKPYDVRAVEYNRAAQRLGQQLPVFYVSVQPRALPDTLHRIIHKAQRRMARDLTLRHGNWPIVQTYRQNILAGIALFGSFRNEQHADWATTLANEAEFLLISVDTGRIQYLLRTLGDGVPQDAPEVQSSVARIQDSYRSMQMSSVAISGLWPAIRFHGIQNQYHKWITGIFKGDFGRSLIDGRPVGTKIQEAIRWTLRINIIAILLAFGIAIPLGVVTAQHAGRLSDKVISSVLFAFYAMPSFWLAMLCIVFLTTAEYGSWLDLFPTGGVGMVTDDMSWWSRTAVRIDHLTLPVICILVGSLAYLTRQMRGSMLRELRQDYIKLARAKGLSERRVLWRHAFRNALFPMITMIGSAFPAAVSGSIILEVIFSIPGMGRLLYQSILSKDWPVVYAMVLLAATLTVIGYLIADLLYKRADPRIVLQTRKP
jgi:peptide/nickel transport system permease protein